LEKYEGSQTRFICPSCQDKRKTFVRYIDTETGNYLPEDFGRCNRLEKCGYHKKPPIETKCLFVPFDEIQEYCPEKLQELQSIKRVPTPKAYRLKINNMLYYLPKTQVFELLEKGCYVSEWFLTNTEPPVPFIQTNYKYFAEGEPVLITTTPKPKPEPTPVSFIPFEIFKASLQGYQANNFIKFLVELFGADIASQLISQYFIGSSKHWNGASVFWQIDIQGRVRTGKIMLYSPTTGKRVKEPFNYITWVHKALEQPEFNLKQCLFGEHLLKDKVKPVALVESEKTAIIASVYLPQFLWLAVGGKENLKPEKLQVLQGRTVVLFPDLKAFDKWQANVQELKHLAKFTVSDLLERKASEADKEKGFDLADYLTRYNFKEFTLTETTQPTNKQNINIKSFEFSCTIKRAKHSEAIEVNNHPTKPEPLKLETWEQEISSLNQFFAAVTLPTQPVQLNHWETITDLPMFLESHFETVRANNGKPTYLPYLKRLQQLKEHLTLNLN
jgi:hypothetical protein